MATITQTINVPASRWLIIEASPEVPVGQVVLTFAPAKTEYHADNASKSHTETGHRVFGCAKGQFRMADDFDAPLDDFKD